ncbi:hypothetical protein [Flagellimonas meridianipacifica]|uniref:hypothetical protein n=1 Tax=Flagellimonas meridianipacifica TaxID=1080225 RepID=UPI000D061B78|nr:hypothetical protein [Allomuricauda pacifica]
MKVVIKHISVVAFIGLLLIKATSFHVYEHHHDDAEEHQNQCELCFLTLFSQQADSLTISVDYVPKEFTFAWHKSKIITLDFPVFMDSPKTDLFSRPPPSFCS